MYLRYDDEKADLVHDEEWEAILAPLTASADVSTATAVDYDDRDLVDTAPTGARYVLGDAPLDEKRFWTQLQRDIVDYLVGSRTIDLSVNRPLKLYSHVGESQEDFTARCTAAADAKADDAAAGLRDKYETRAKRIKTQLDSAQSRADIAESQAHASRQNEVAGVAGGLLGSFLGGRKSSVRCWAGSAAASEARRHAAVRPPRPGYGSRRRSPR